ncbi:hypothetical protein BJX96DRAFT_180444 [Aspergillus floccosus]
MHNLTASIRFESERAWEDFAQDDDEKTVEQIFRDKNVTIRKPISATHHTPPVLEVTLEAEDDVEAEDIQRAKYPDGVLVHVEED